MAMRVLFVAALAAALVVNNVASDDAHLMLLQRNAVIKKGDATPNPIPAPTAFPPVVYSEGVSGMGWSEGRIGRGRHQFTTQPMHGPWGNDVREVSRTFITSGSGLCKVKWTSYGMHTRDNEFDMLFINEVAVWEQRMVGGKKVDEEWMGACTPNLEVKFMSHIDQHIGDEAWGFGNVEVSEDGSVLYSESLSGNGWSSDIVGFGRVQFTNEMMHGPWGNNVKEVKRVFPLSAGVNHCTVQWTSYGMHSRDGEKDRLFIDGNKIWEETMRGGSKANREWSGPCADSLELKFASDIDEHLHNEAWGFSNVRILQRFKQPNQNWSNPLVYTEGLRGDGWSSGTTGVGRHQFTRTEMHGPWGNNVKEVKRTFATSGSGICKVRWTSYGMHTRDSEVDRLFINGDMVWGVRMWGGRQEEQEWSGACTESLELKFTSNIDEHLGNEAWGFGNVVVSQDGSVLYSEETFGEGWSSGTVGVGRTHFTSNSMHGPWGNEVKEVKRTFPLARDTSECTVKWTSYGMHTRDNEKDRLFIDGKKVWEDNMRGGKRVDKEWTGSCSGSIELKFASDIDQSIGDESWGFGNVQISQKPA